jgi:uncharacterized membrane protein YphA (DoxX/SURF4 family)
MLSVFPHLLDFRLYGPLVLRVAVGLYLLYFGYMKFVVNKDELWGFFEQMGFKPGSYYANALAVIEIIVGVCFIVGFLTQIAAAIGIVIGLMSLVISVRHPGTKLRSPLEYALLLAISIALLLMGAGKGGIDLPL